MKRIHWLSFDKKKDYYVKEIPLMDLCYKSEHSQELCCRGLRLHCGVSVGTQPVLCCKSRGLDDPRRSFEKLSEFSQYENAENIGQY